MPTVAKVRWNKLEYGWMFKLSGLLDVMDYWEKVRSNRVRDGFSNFLRSREMSDLVGVRGANDEHMSHPDAFGIYCKFLSPQIAGGLEAVSGFSHDLISAMLKGIDKAGTIYVNSKGGWFPAAPGFEELETREAEEWVLPTDTISVKKWPGGKHWYASVGGRSVVRNNEEKWSSKASAQMQAELWAKENGIVLEEEER